MAEQDRNTTNQNQTTDDIDRALDAALARYASVEPRAGLEARVLANLRTESSESLSRIWWGWSLAAGAIAVAALALALSLGKHSPKVIAVHPPVTTKGAPSGINVASGNAVRPQEPIRTHKTVKRAPRPTAVAEANPKLDQFPSPQPLSEQERILANYVVQFPKQAALIARLRTEALQQDQLERMRVWQRDGANSNEQKNDTTER